MNYTKFLHSNGGWVQFIPAAISAGSALYKGITGNQDQRGDSRLEGYEVPDFKEDADYRETQDFLKGYGMDMLGGEVPEYYKGIGETGGKEFEDYLNLGAGDIQRSAMEGSAALGRGGGRALDVASEAVGDFTTKARWDDYNRALEGKRWLMGQGRGITERVRGAGQTQQQQENAFALDRAGLDYKRIMGISDFDAEQDAMQGEMWGNLASMGVSAGVGYMTGGPVGAVAGAMGGMDWGALMDSATSSKSSTTGTPIAKRTKLGQIGNKIDPSEFMLSGALN